MGTITERQIKHPKIETLPMLIPPGHTSEELTDNPLDDVIFVRSVISLNILSGNKEYIDLSSTIRQKVLANNDATTKRIEEALKDPSFGAEENAALNRYLHEQKEEQERSLTPLLKRRDAILLQAFNEHRRATLEKVTADLPLLGASVRVLASIYAEHVARKRRGIMERCKNMLIQAIIAQTGTLQKITRGEFDLPPFEELKQTLTPKALPDVYRLLRHLLQDIETVTFPRAMQEFLQGTVNPFTGAGLYLDALKERDPHEHAATLAYIRAAMSAATSYTPQFFKMNIDFFLQEPIKERPALPIVKVDAPRQAKQFVHPTDKATAKIFGGAIPYGGAFNFDIGKDTKGDILSRMIIKAPAPQMKVYAPDDRSNFNIFDRIVNDVLYSFYQMGQNEVSYTSIGRAILGNVHRNIKNGNSSPVKVHETLLQAIEASIRKQRLSNVIIDMTESVKFYHPEKFKNRKKGGRGKVIIEGYLMPAKACTITYPNGMKAGGIQIIDKPILLDHVEGMNRAQIERGDISLFQTTKRQSLETIIIKEILIDQIYQIKRTPVTGRTNRISYDTIYSEVQRTLYSMAIDKALWIDEKEPPEAPPEMDRYHLKRIRDAVSSLLEDLSTSDSGQFIKGGKEYKDGRKIAGVEIITPRKALPSKPKRK